MKRFNNILFVADSSSISTQAFHRAVDLAERNGARLTVLVAMEQLPVYLTRLTPHILRQLRLEEQKEALDKLCAWASDRVEVEQKIIEGKPYLEIVRDVLRYGRDLVIKTAEGDDGAFALLFGTLDMHLLRKCPCPIWIMKSTDPVPIRRIIAAVDFNEDDPPDQDTKEPFNQKILELAGSLAVLENSELHVAHAWDAIGEEFLASKRTGLTPSTVKEYVEGIRSTHQAWLDQLMDKAESWFGQRNGKHENAQAHLLRGDPREAIPALATKLEADLIVMGTVARTGIPGMFIGITAESILGEIKCSVLAVKPDGFVSPVTLED